MAYGKPEVQSRIYDGSPIIPILSRIIPMPRVVTYLFKIHSKDIGIKTAKIVW